MASKEDKKDILQELANTKQTLINLETSLRLAKKTKDADEVRKKSKSLQREIDRLLASALEDWLGATKQLRTDIAKANKSLEGAIDDLKKKLEFAKNLIKVIGFIDDVIGLARSPLKKAVA